MIVKTAHSPLGIVLGSIKDNVADELAILQRLSALYVLVIVNVNDRVLVLGRYVIVVKELGAAEGLPLELAFKLGILSLKHVLVVKLGMEEITRALNIGNARLPIYVEDIHLLNADIAEPVQLRLVPYRLIYARALLDLLPHYIGIGVLKVVLLKHTRYDRGKHTRLASVAALTREYIRLGVSLHSVGVLRYQYVMKPARRALIAAVRADVGVLFLLYGVAELPPILRSHNARLGLNLARLVFFKYLEEGLKLLGTDRDHPACGSSRFLFYFHRVLLSQI